MLRRLIFTSGLGLLALWAGLSAFPDALGRGKPNIIVLTVESTRTEMFSPEITPHIWRALKSGTLFTRHRAVSAWTAPNIIAILTGVPPYDQGIFAGGHSIPDDWQTPLEDLTDAGWTVAGLQSFMKINLFRHLGVTVKPGHKTFGWLARRALRREPFVLWHHYTQTHLPYAPSPPFRPDWRKLLPPDDPGAASRIDKVMTSSAVVAKDVTFKAGDKNAISALYRGGFREFDNWFKNFWTFLADSGLRENTIVILTADHGEEILDRGLVGHASTTRQGHLHEEIIRLPLVVWLPKRWQRPQPAVVDRISDHLDIMPTLMAMVGQNPTRPLSGRDIFAQPPSKTWSAMSSRAGFAEPDPNNVTEFVHARLEPPWKFLLRTHRGKIVERELYNLKDDPGEVRNLVKSQPKIAAAMQKRLMGSVLTMRPPWRSSNTGCPKDINPANRPRFIFPAQSGMIGLDDLGERVRLKWSGDPACTYRIQYIAGEGANPLKGEFSEQGTVYDFGPMSQKYWLDNIVSYGMVRLRVGPAGREDMWSDWLELRVRP